MQQPEVFRGTQLPRVLDLVRATLGEEAVIIAIKSPAENDGRQYEVVAAPADFQLATPVSERNRPNIIALVGPPGSGKTTTAVKLALSPEGFANRKTGLLTLDTYRAAAVEQLEVFAGIANLPLEVAFDAADAGRALERLSDCEVVIVDTPGRGLRGATELDWQASLAAVRADEVHLVMPASIRTDIARAIRDAHSRCGLTHTLITMRDEMPAGSSISELVNALALPMRWLTAGPAVPEDLNRVITGRAQRPYIHGVA